MSDGGYVEPNIRYKYTELLITCSFLSKKLIRLKLFIFYFCRQNSISQQAYN